MKCPVCQKETNSFVSCGKYGVLICWEHCEQCQWFGGTMLWSCLIGKKQQKAESFGEKAVAAFRDKIAAIDKKIAAKKHKKWHKIVENH